jgi:hypothetical protein
MLVKRQNEFLTRCGKIREQYSGVDGVVELSNVTSNMLLSDISSPFASCVAMYSLKPDEIQYFSSDVKTSCPFMMDRIMGMVRKKIIMPFMLC